MMFRTKYNQEQIDEKREAIKSSFLRSCCRKENPTVDDLNTIPNHNHILLLIKSYDKHFFNNWFANNGLKIVCRWNSKLTAAAGRCIYPTALTYARPQYEDYEDQIKSRVGMCLFHGGKVCDIELSAPIINSRAFSKLDVEIVNGLEAHDKLDIMMIVLEHELCHILSVLLYGEGGHGFLFKSLVVNLFGHTDIRHSIASYPKTLAAQSPEELEKSFIEEAKKQDIPTSWFGKKYMWNDKHPAIIIAIMPKRYKYNIVVEVPELGTRGRTTRKDVIWSFRVHGDKI